MSGAALRTSKKLVPRTERQRQFLVRLVYLVFVLMLIEGPLRKWFAPGLSTPLFFLRVPLLVFLYAYFFQTVWFGRIALFQFWLLFAFVSTLIGGIGYLIDGTTLIAWGVGSLNYWLYLPLMFVVARTFSSNDILRMMRWNLILAIPYAALIVAQYRSPPYAWINKGIAADAEAVTVAQGIVRPYGLFTWTSQNVDFTAFLVAALFFFVLSADRSWRDRLLIFCAAPAIASLSVLTGSRSIYFLVGAIVLGVIGGAFLAGKIRVGLKSLLAVSLLGVLAGGLFMNQFDDMFIAMRERFELAERSEGAIEQRALSTVTGLFEPLRTAPLFGEGIGRGTPSVQGFLGEQALALGENDLQRNINELGIIFGLAFVAMRFWLAIFLIRRSVGIARRGGFAALPFVGFAAIALIAGQLTFSALNGFLPWLTIGFLLALVRQYAEKQPQTERLHVPARRSTLTSRKYPQFAVK